ncbi:MAG TPA: hypothetical protein VHG08_03035 [Longimicrobium sp.]|nr:hypothetical protein [Longimicrobium sp.]
MLLRTAFIAAVVFAVPAAGQTVNLQVEQRVRIVAPTVGLTSPTAAVVVGIERDTAVLQIAQSQLQVPLAAISRIEHSRGTRRVGTAAVGALLGAGAGYLVASSRERVARTDTLKEPCETSLECPLGFQFVFVKRYGSRDYALTMGSAALLGVAIGAYFGSERWERVPLYAGAAPDGRNGELGFRLQL